jgi:hypothetical protein
MKNINERLYQTSLLSVEWPIPTRTARLTFSDDDVRLVLHLDGIHCVVFRPTLRSALPSFGPDCHVFFASISRDTGFLDRYLNDRNLFLSHIAPHDGEGRAPDDARFQRPYHVAIVCVCGHLDLLANSVEVQEEPFRSVAQVP